MLPDANKMNIDVQHPGGLAGHPGLRQLEEAALAEIVETFRRAPRGLTGFPNVRPSDCRDVTLSLRNYFEANLARFRTGEPTVQPFFFGLLDRFAESDIRSYPNELAHLNLLRTEALLLANRHEEALACCAPLAEKPYLIEDDPSTLEKLFEFDTLLRLNLGRNDEVEAVAMGRLLLLVRLRRRKATRLFRQFFPMLGVSPATPAQYSLLEVPVRLIARLWVSLLPFVNTRYRPVLRPLMWPLAFFGGLFLNVLARFAGPLRLQTSASAQPGTRPRRRTIAEMLSRNVTRTSDVLVTRAMGGVGDLAMMSPGLVALAKKRGRPVHFATKRHLFPVLENNPHIRLLDIDSTIEMQQFSRWINLSFCPAARYESRKRPRIKKSRVELFARAMRISRKDLARYGLQPQCHLSPAQELIRRKWRSDFCADGMPLVGIQPFSRDTYRSCASLLAAATKIAAHAKVVVLHSTPVAIDAHPNIMQMFGKPMSESIAAIAACDYFISVDSAFFHVAAAFDIPSIGIFGPTDGQVISSHHPRALLIDTADTFACAPCWRNENKPCFLTGGMISVCLSSVSVERITGDFDRLLARYPFRQRQATESNHQ